MKRLLLTTIVTFTLALAGAASARAPADVSPPGNAYGAYGCCCPWSVHAGLCPSGLTDFLLALPEVCMLLDDDAEVVGFCVGDPDGFYPFRDLSYPEAAEFLGQASVGAMVDFFCGFDHSHWLED